MLARGKAIKLMRLNPARAGLFFALHYSFSRLHEVSKMKIFWKNFKLKSLTVLLVWLVFVGIFLYGLSGLFGLSNDSISKITSDRVTSENSSTHGGTEEVQVRDQIESTTAQPIELEMESNFHAGKEGAKTLTELQGVLESIESEEGASIKIEAGASPAPKNQSGGPEASEQNSPTDIDSRPNPKVPKKLKVSVSVDGSPSFEVSANEGSNQCDVLSQALVEGKISSLIMRYNDALGSNGIFVINGIGLADQVWWVYEIDGKSVPYGCSKSVVKGGERVSWKYLGPR